ncbi:transglutaminase domain-containing protein [Mucilaginibacter terrenus]|nr:transglutaminase domain-containing protein [Mucilaginibacter terrenus]
MKKILLLAFSCLTISTAIAQMQPAADDFEKFTKDIEAQRYAATQAKEYAKADELLKSWIVKYDEADANRKDKYKSWAASIYYNLACYEALLGRKEPALTAFEKCYALGYNNYKSTMEDSDLNTLHQEKRFKAVMQGMREKSDYSYVIQHAGPYNKVVDKTWPAFTYQQAEAPELVALRNKFNLDSVSGNGDEISKFKNLLYWAHNSVRHDGNSSNPSSRNAIDLIAVCQKENRGVNCRMMATILRDAYQAEGFKTRVVTCMPKDTADNDCHVITVVWSKSLNKWVWMDPTFNAYVADGKGNLLSIEEVRERLVKGIDDLVLNPDANWNNKQKQTKEHYLGYYMSKNLYWLQCAAKSEWDIETNKPGKQASDYLNLYPGDYNTLHQPKKQMGRSDQYAVNNPKYFWQKPADK